MKRPSFQFYPGDWLRDMKLRGCSIEARGLWVDLLCLMHDGHPYGHLSTEAGPWTDEQGARATGLSIRAYKKALGELEGAGVFSRDEQGGVFSRRMVKDEDIRQKRANSGSIGGSKTQAKRRANSQANDEEMVASADADEGGSQEKGSGEKPTGPIFASLVRRLDGHPARFSVVELLTTHLPSRCDPDAWAGSLIGCLDGTLLSGGMAVTVEELAAACVEYPGIPNCGWSPAHFLASVRRTATRLRRGGNVRSKAEASESTWLASRR